MYITSCCEVCPRNNPSTPLAHLSCYAVKRRITLRGFQMVPFLLPADNTGQFTAHRSDVVRQRIAGCRNFLTAAHLQNGVMFPLVPFHFMRQEEMEPDVSI